MISAPSHRQQSSGNKLFWALCLVFFSCSVSKKSAQTKPVQIVNGKKIEQKSAIDTIQPVDGNVIATKENPVVKIPNQSKPDTSGIKDTSMKKPEASDGMESQYDESTDFKKSYNVKLLIPLNADGIADPASSRFVHFYAGVLKGLKELDEEGVKLKITVIDTEIDNYKIAEDLYNIVDSGTDMVIGPFERDDLKLLTEECKIRSIPLVSPWQTSTKLTKENPYYIQLNPNLKEHYVKLAETAVNMYQPGEVVIVGKNTKETNSWIKYFQQTAFDQIKTKDFFSSYFVSSDSLSTGPTAFYTMLKNPKVKAVILPQYSYTDEDLLYSCLRRLSAEKGSRNISVFGMPILFDSDKIDFDFYHALQMKVVMSDFVDENYGLIRDFRRDFLDKYGEIPEPDAIKGYDIIMYLGRNIWRNGKNFQNHLSDQVSVYLQSTFDIHQVKSEDSLIADDPLKFDYFENKHLDIIEFKGNKWQRKP